MEMTVVGEYEEIEYLRERYGTPFYIFCKDNLLENYNSIDTAFRSRYRKFIIGYSYKTNYLPYLCETIKERGGYAEVVSRLEYDLAWKIGQEPTKIIFNGPLKTYDDIQLALNNGSIINLDSSYEIEHVKKYAEEHPSKNIQIGLRVNLKLSKDGVSHIQGGLGVGRFGFDIEEGLANAISRLKRSRNVQVVGLHGHTSTTDRSLWSYRTITQTLCELATKYLVDSIEYIDVGGGIYGRIPPEMGFGETPTFDEYAQTICEVMEHTRWAQGREPYLILEPGVSMVANVLDFVAQVIDIKEIRGKRFVLVDGSMYNTKPMMHAYNQPVKVIKRNHTNETHICDVVGYTCMEKDHLLRDVTIPRITKGDFLIIKNVGAYTIVLLPPFIRESPPILVKDSDRYRIIKQRGSVESCFIDYVFS
ncbi:MAG: diaminopimelate decarboxylase [Chloroflexi bacterium]|nr:diaminopimelate decarboxylase [Chloroflexota bacterium]